ncbi:MAG: phosphatase [Siculibacillus sp.]|nr:phosphatase [Siculibacillus sp.]
MAKDRRASLMPVPGTPGRLHLSACPGTWRGEADRASVRRDLARIAECGAALLVTLIDEKELPLPLADWRAEVEAAGLELRHLPISDYGVPDDRFEREWSRARLADRLVAGETVALHCRAGLGRTGTIAARLLIEISGLDAEAAIATVRRDHVAEAVETAEQVHHLRRLSERLSRED